MGMMCTATDEHKDMDDGREGEGKGSTGYSAHKGDDVTEATGLDEGKYTCGGGTACIYTAVL